MSKERCEFHSWKTMSYRVLPTEFYARDSAVVAEELLGNLLIRKLNESLLVGIMVEVEAYYGLDDPASRAYHGKKKFNLPMWKKPGQTFIYNVHKYWMLNVVAHEANQVGAVLIRALHPIKGIDVMRTNRPVARVVELTNGPGKLTTALKIDKSLTENPVTTSNSEIFIANDNNAVEIGSSHRIGVKKDLEEKLRFYIKGNRFVSKYSVKQS